jgi:hypothetical protein
MAVQPLRTLFWKTAGGMVIAAMCTGVLVSFWIGQQIQDSLTSIATLQQSTLQQEKVKIVLTEERDGLLSTPRLVARAAVQSNLYQATAKQQMRLRD